jgi:tetrapyrrole methylase family protein/MazG family protein
MRNLLSKSEKYTFEDLRQVMDILRGDNGCPWDLEQTHESLRSATLEEAYEVIDAIDNKDIPNLKEELGDLLLHVVFHSKIACDDENFTLDDVIHGIVEKLIRRHPHVFKDARAKDAGQVMVQWEDIKKEEKQYENHSQKLKGVPKALPALVRAYKVQKKAAEIGFDFPDYQAAFEKVHEEIKELEMALKDGKKALIEEEYGDLLFSIVNISRFFEINPEISLTNATEKFINRFKGIEEMAENKGFNLNELSLNEMDNLWETFKRRGQ